jgi:LPPG:FO 2-phospho-L-lactate transferase
MRPASNKSGPVVLLSGGVGGAKLADGLYRTLAPESLTVIGNVGDDIERHGLWVSPDVDILTYTLAGMVDAEKGWGFADETFHALAILRRLGEETWFNLGDRDLATHILRTRLRREGVRPTGIAARIAAGLEVRCTVLPATDDTVQTHVQTEKGWLHFQEYLVRDRAEAAPLDVRCEGADEARPTPEVLSALAGASAILLAPSNPVASIGPMLAVPGFRDAMLRSGAPRIAVCPIVGGRSLKGPSDRMLKAKGLTADPMGVADWYGDLLDGMVVDEADAQFEGMLKERGLEVLVTGTVMQKARDRDGLAEATLAFARTCSASPKA